MALTNYSYRGTGQRSIVLFCPGGHMSDDVRASRAIDCKVCAAPHDEGIHEATLSIHRWFRAQVTQYLYDDEYEYEEVSPAEQVA
jgi:hypothetical protein